MKNKDKDQVITELQEEVAMLRRIISIMPGNFFWKDAEGRYQGCNIHEAKLLGLKLGLNSPEEIIGKSDEELIGPELAKKMHENNLEVIQNRQEFSFEEHAFDVNKSTAVYLTKKVPILGENNEVKGILGISFDITERKQMEEKLIIAKQKAEAANRAKSRFLAMISHELRTPLTSILGFTRLIENESLDAEKKLEYLQHISSSGYYLLSLINNLLDYSKLETNKFELISFPINLYETIHDVISMLQGAADVKKVKITQHIDTNVPKFLTTNDGILRQILMNLIGNAIKFTAEGSIQVGIRHISETVEHIKLEISVSDTGCGIPTREQKSIFKRFYQIGNIYTRDASLAGTGLGLAIVKKLTQALGGKIKVESAEGQGSKFYFTANFQKTTVDARQEKPKESIPTPRILRKNLRALLLEDNKLIQIIHKSMLEELHCKVDLAESVSEATSLLSNHYDIILVDIGLPEIAGFEFIKTIRNSSEALAETPIIVVTGYSEKEEIEYFLQTGADDVLIKPVSPQTLQKAISRYCAKSEVV